MPPPPAVPIADQTASVDVLDDVDDVDDVDEVEGPAAEATEGPTEEPIEEPAGDNVSALSLADDESAEEAPPVTPTPEAGPELDALSVLADGAPMRELGTPPTGDVAPTAYFSDAAALDGSQPEAKIAQSDRRPTPPYLPQPPTAGGAPVNAEDALNIDRAALEAHTRSLLERATEMTVQGADEDDVVAHLVAGGIRPGQANKLAAKVRTDLEEGRAEATASSTSKAKGKGISPALVISLVLIIAGVALAVLDVEPVGSRIPLVAVIAGLGMALWVVFRGSK